MMVTDLENISLFLFNHIESEKKILTQKEEKKIRTWITKILMKNKSIDQKRAKTKLWKKMNEKNKLNQGRHPKKIDFFFDLSHYEGNVQ